MLRVLFNGRFFLSLIQLSKFFTQLERPGTEFANTSVHSDQYKLSCALRYAVKAADRSKTNLLQNLLRKHFIEGLSFH